MEEKTWFRSKVRELKGMRSEEELQCKSAAVWAQVEAMPRFRNAASVLMYWSMPGEVHTHEFIGRWSGKKTIILPVIDGNNLRLASFEGEDSLRKNVAMNLYEPQGGDFAQPVDLAIAPGIAFDRNNHRMGRGHGYYDRLLPSLRTYCIGVCFDFQLFDAIPYGEYDVPVDEVMAG